MTTRRILALVAVATLALGAAACSSDEQSDATTTTAAPSTTSSTSGGDATTTTAAGGGDGCTRGDIISAALTQVDPRFDLMDSFGCEDGYAWAWLADDSTEPATLQSAILEDRNGTWVPLDLANICGAASAGYPPEVLEKGCAYQTPSQPTSTTASS
jgi:ABC-type transport system substrate-binding protein